MATSSKEPLPFDTEVLVIGAGPIGLTTANALRHHGVACRILEEKPAPSKYSRANNVWARPQELLDSVGLRAPLAERSYLVDRIHIFIDEHPLDDVKLGEAASPFPQALYSGQDVMEKTLAEQLAARGVQVERGRKAMRIEPDDEGITVWVASTEEQAAAHGEFERIRCRYLVGADGAEGTVRKAVGLDYQPEKFKGRANHQADAKLSWQRSTEPNQLWFFAYHNGFAGVMPVWGGYHRLFFLEDEQLVPDRDPTLAEIQQRAREVTGDATLTLTDPIWLTHSRFQHAVAPAYSKGRVYLVGDAGHLTLPIGGQGMNTGFHDAVGLAWRLAQTLAGHAGPAVLDSYSPERHGIHAALDAEQAKGFKHLLYRNRLEDKLLGAAGQLFPHIGWQLLGSGDGQQLLVSYADSPLSEDHLRWRQLLHPGGPRAGDRAPDAQVTTPEGEAMSLFASIYNPDGQTYGWSLLAFDGRQADALPQLAAAIAEVAGWPWVRPRLVLAAPLASPAAAGTATCLADRDGHAHKAYHLEGQPALLLVRPDGHLAFRGPADQPELLRQYCARILGTPQAPPQA
ncbi:FAD-binding monooxygenase [Hymenobacter setariae]|uniref:FAD-binding monooxygenase n=1 Tax=Hymenobacter setariae TaxID=2594794 RepID=A0A558C3F9_9BACT|nr:FAD-dependent monooxygenase [Hymenobacter setariae]TVT43308.1 FAD-binding monooxygenase [Hymenobacter setariae]